MRISKYLHNHKGFIEPYQLEQSLKDIKFDNKLLQFQNWQLFYISMLYPRYSKMVKAVIMKGRGDIALSCIECCKNSKDCNKIDKKDSCIHFFENLYRANNTRFFDTSGIVNNREDCLTNIGTI